jgi:FkbM family methyltransferase
MQDLSDASPKADIKRHFRPKRRLKWLANTLAMEGPLNIADIGANPTHAPPYENLMNAGHAKVWGFEPNPAAFALLQEDPNPNRIIFNKAVGKPGPATYYSHQISNLSSLFQIKASCARFLGKGFWANRKVDEVPVDLVGLDTLTEMPPLDLLKMDLQGGELGVLENAVEKLATTMAVVCEVRFYRMYEGEPMWAEVDQELRRQGFVLHKIMHTKTVRLDQSQKERLKGKGFKSQLLDGDAAYIRNIEDPESITTAQWKALALVSAAVLKSHDLCLYCLDELARRGEIKKSVPVQYCDKLLGE